MLLVLMAVTGWCPHQFASSSDRIEQQEPFPPFLPLFLPKNSYNPLIAADSSGSSTFGAVVPHLHGSYAQGCWSEMSQGPILEGRDTSEHPCGGSRCYAHCSAFGGDACSVRSKTAEDGGDTCSSCSLGTRVCRNPQQEVLPKPWAQSSLFPRARRQALGPRAGCREAVSHREAEIM